MFSIEIKRLWWINDNGEDNPEDLCLHGEVIARIGEETLEDDCTISAAALYLLRSLTEDHAFDSPGVLFKSGLMLPCCGHSMHADGENVLIIDCPYGTDWAVHHVSKSVELMTEQGERVIVPFEEYRETVLSFADQVMTYYFQCQPKILPEEDFSRDGYLAFWREWARRRGIALEDTPVGRCRGGVPAARGFSMNLSDVPRIAIIGSPGSGKSTLARQLAEKTGHPLIHLDYYYWQPGFVAIPKAEFIAMQHEWMKGERWIIDGNYKGTLELRFAAADLVIYLDLPPLLCAWRAIRRHGKQRPDMRPGVVEAESGIFSKDFREFFGFIWNFRKDAMPKILALHEKYPGVEFMRIKTTKEYKALLK